MVSVNMDSFINNVQRYKNVYEKYGSSYEKKKNNIINIRTLSNVKFLEFSAESAFKSFLNLTITEQKSFILSCIFKRVLEYINEISYLETKETLKQIKDYIQDIYHENEEKDFSWSNIDTSVNPMFFHMVNDVFLCEKVDEIRKWLKDELDVNKIGLNKQLKIVLQRLTIKSIDKIFTKEDSLSVDLNHSYDMYVHDLMDNQIKKNVKNNHLSLNFSIIDRDKISSELVNKLLEYFNFKIAKKDNGAMVSLLNIKRFEKSNCVNSMEVKEKIVKSLKDIDNKIEAMQAEPDGEYISLNFLKVFNQSLLMSPSSFFSDYSLRNYLYIMKNLFEKISTEYGCSLYLDEKDNCLKFNAGIINKNVINVFEQFASELGKISFQSVQFAYGLKDETDALNDFFKKINENFESLYLLTTMLKEGSLAKNEISLKTRVKKF